MIRRLLLLVDVVGIIVLASVFPACAAFVVAPSSSSSCRHFPFALRSIRIPADDAGPVHRPDVIEVSGRGKKTSSEGAGSPNHWAPKPAVTDQSIVDLRNMPPKQQQSAAAAAPTMRNYYNPAQPEIDRHDGDDTRMPPNQSRGDGYWATKTVDENPPARTSPTGSGVQMKWDDPLAWANRRAIGDTRFIDPNARPKIPIKTKTSNSNWFPDASNSTTTSKSYTPTYSLFPKDNKNKPPVAPTPPAAAAAAAAEPRTQTSSGGQGVTTPQRSESQRSSTRPAQSSSATISSLPNTSPPQTRRSESHGSSSAAPAQQFSRALHNTPLSPSPTPLKIPAISSPVQPETTESDDYYKRSNQAQPFPVGREQSGGGSRRSSSTSSSSNNNNVEMMETSKNQQSYSVSSSWAPATSKQQKSGVSSRLPVIPATIVPPAPAPPPFYDSTPPPQAVLITPPPPLSNSVSTTTNASPVVAGGTSTVDTTTTTTTRQSYSVSQWSPAASKFSGAGSSYLSNLSSSNTAATGSTMPPQTSASASAWGPAAAFVTPSSSSSYTPPPPTSRSSSTAAAAAAAITNDDSTTRGLQETIAALAAEMDRLKQQTEELKKWDTVEVTWNVADWSRRITTTNNLVRLKSPNVLVAGYSMNVELQMNPATTSAAEDNDDDDDDRNVGVYIIWNGGLDIAPVQVGGSSLTICGNNNNSRRGYSSLLHRVFAPGSAIHEMHSGWGFADMTTVGSIKSLFLQDDGALVIKATIRVERVTSVNV